MVHLRGFPAGQVKWERPASARLGSSVRSQVALAKSGTRSFSYSSFLHRYHAASNLPHSAFGPRGGESDVPRNRAALPRPLR